MATQETTLPEVNEAGEVVHQIQGGDLSQEQSTVRAFYKFLHKKDKSGKELSNEDGSPVWDLKIQAKAESANKENWKKLEESGWKPLNEVDFTRYTIKTETAFSELVSDETQRVYISQSGVNYIQNSKMNALAVEIQPNTGTSPDNPPIPVHDNERIDLKESINEKPGRRALSPMEKLDRMLEQMGMDATARAVFLRTAATQYEAAKAAGTLPADEEEEEEETTPNHNA